LFISFEGGEGAGKTTLIRKLYAQFEAQGRRVIATRAPGGTPVGNQIREILLHSEGLSPRCELMLFLADRAQHVDTVILPALTEDAVVLCDRFNDSTVAYQAGARGFDAEWVRRLCAFATKDLQPDVTLYLDLDPALGLQRVAREKDRIESENLAFHQKIRKAYREIAKLEPRRFHILDASQPPETVFEQALDVLSSYR